MLTGQCAMLLAGGPEHALCRAPNALLAVLAGEGLLRQQMLRGLFTPPQTSAPRCTSAQRKATCRLCGCWWRRAGPTCTVGFSALSNAALWFGLQLMCRVGFWYAEQAAPSYAVIG